MIEYKPPLQSTGAKQGMKECRLWGLRSVEGNEGRQSRADSLLGIASGHVRGCRPLFLVVTDKHDLGLDSSCDPPSSSWTPDV